MTANPKSLDDQSTARTITQLTYDECVSMSRLGAEVLQQQAAEMARKYKIAVTVRNFRETDRPSTTIGSHAVTTRDDRVTAVVDQPSLLVFDLETPEERLALQITERLERQRLTFFRVTARAAQARFAVRPFKYRDVELMVRDVIESRGAKAQINTGDFALVSIVGEALRQRLDAWSEQSERVLIDAGIELYGSSRDEISLSFLVGEADRKKAVECLHRRLVL